MESNNKKPKDTIIGTNVSVMSRVIALGIDIVVIVCFQRLIVFLMCLLFRHWHYELVKFTDETSVALFRTVMTILLYIGGWFYFTLFESSKQSATFGKYLLKIAVKSKNGEQLSFIKAGLRSLLKPLLLLFNIWTMLRRNKQAAHDLLIGAIVIKVDYAYQDVDPLNALQALLLVLLFNVFRYAIFITHILLFNTKLHFSLSETFISYEAIGASINFFIMLVFLRWLAVRTKLDIRGWLYAKKWELKDTSRVIIAFLGVRPTIQAAPCLR